MASKSFDSEGAITITFGDQVENGVHMEKIGTMLERGFLLKELEEAKKKFIEKGFNAIHFNMKELLYSEALRKEAEPASILVVKDGIRAFCDPDDLFQEQIVLLWDAKKYSRGRIVNSLARRNLCYADFDQEPDYENSKGRIYDFKKLKELNKIRKGLGKYLGEKAKNLYAEGNYYYDIHPKKEGKCGIGWHGDAERKIVIGMRVGPSFPIEFQWYQNGKFVQPSKRLHIDLHHGDFYAMSDKTTGNDWKKRKILTLRHAAGNKKKYLDANGTTEDYHYL
jgi:hypothetical protein